MLYDSNNPPYRQVRTLHRFFFALLPPPQLARLARQFANATDWFDGAGTPVAADRQHITMFILPDLAEVPDDLIERLLAVGANVAAAPVEVALDYVSGSGRSVALRPQHRIAGLADLHHAIARLCPGYGVEERPDYAFHPHITLGYRDGRPFGQRIKPVAWTATEFVLIHSHVGHTRHTVLGRWPLIAGEPQQGSLF